MVCFWKVFIVINNRRKKSLFTMFQLLNTWKFNELFTVTYSTIHVFHLQFVASVLMGVSYFYERCTSCYITIFLLINQLFLYNVSIVIPAAEIINRRKELNAQLQYNYAIYCCNYCGPFKCSSVLVSWMHWQKMFLFIAKRAIRDESQRYNWTDINMLNNRWNCNIE